MQPSSSECHFQPPPTVVHRLPHTWKEKQGLYVHTKLEIKFLASDHVNIWVLSGALNLIVHVLFKKSTPSPPPSSPPELMPLNYLRQNETRSFWHFLFHALWMECKLKLEETWSLHFFSLTSDTHTPHPGGRGGGLIISYQSTCKSYPFLSWDC